MFTFGFDMNDFPTFNFEIYVGNALIQQATQQIPFPMAMNIFVSQVQELAQQPQPMKLVCKSTKNIEVKPEEWAQKPVSLTYYNNKWDGEFN